MGLIQNLQLRGINRGYQRHVVALEPVLRRMSARGIPVNAELFASVEAQLKGDMARYFAEMQALVPDEVKVLKVYKRKPSVYLPWKPSNKALIRYMRHRGHTVPKALKTGKDTTNELELKRLARSTGDSLYRKVLEYRNVQTVLSNHIHNWRPGPDDRVHPVFYFDPATGQLSSRRPNAQNAPRHDDKELGTKYATMFRSMIKARPGHTLIEFDYGGFHVQTLAFEAQDADLLRIGKIDLHSFVTAHFLHLGDAESLFRLPDAELKSRLAAIKRDHKHDRDAKVKHAILGYNNGMGYKKLYKQYQEYFANEGEARRVIALMDSLFPKAKAYREAICQKAHDQGYLISRHGYIRYFWEVFRWQGGGWSHGDDHEAALCFFTQNDAHGELKDRILTLDELGYLDKYGFINTIHDSIMMECPNNLLDECYKNVRMVMEAPSTVLVDPVVAPNGLSVEVEAKAGPDWSNMKGL